MKQLSTILLCIILFSGCSKKEYCWKFTTSSTTTASRTISGYPKTDNFDTERCELTEDEAEFIAKSSSGTSTIQVNNYTLTTVTTVVVAKK